MFPPKCSGFSLPFLRCHWKSAKVDDNPRVNGHQRKSTKQKLCEQFSNLRSGSFTLPPRCGIVGVSPGCPLLRLLVVPPCTQPPPSLPSFLRTPPLPPAAFRCRPTNRGISLIRITSLPGPYLRLSRVIWWSYGGGLFLMSEVPLYMKAV